MRRHQRRAGVLLTIGTNIAFISQCPRSYYQRVGGLAAWFQSLRTLSRVTFTHQPLSLEFSDSGGCLLWSSPVVHVHYANRRVDFIILNVIVFSMRPSTCNRKRTLAAVAKECGVSPITVSRALRENARVKDETRRKIRATAERLGYFNNPNLGRPRATAPAPDSVDVVLGTKSGPQSLFYASLVMTLEHELRHHGLDCVVRRCAESYDGFVRLADSLRQSRAKATLLLGEFSAEKLTTIMTIVPGALLLDNPGPPGLDIPYGYLAFDNAEAARLAVRHLVQNGRRRIALLTGAKSHYFSKELEIGYREELTARGLTPDADLVWDCDFHADGARNRILQALTAKTAFDAVFTSDELACGVLQALASQEIKVPAQVAVVGCDGLPVGLLVYPRLSTVVLDSEELGRLAVERILNPDAAGRFTRTRLLPRLLVRDSSVAAPLIGQNDCQPTERRSVTLN